MHNEHVYLFFRWQGWLAQQRGSHMRAFFMRDFARQERKVQQRFNAD